MTVIPHHLRFAGSTILHHLWGLLAIPVILIATPLLAEEPSPNVVVFMVDDLGWQDVSHPFGPEITPLNRRYHTPNLERLALRGTTFTDAYAASPVCTPTRTAFLTGRHPARTGITYWTLHADRDTSAAHPRLRNPPWRLQGLAEGDVTLPSIFERAGYRTVHLGKAHFGAIGTSGADPTRLGFETNIAGHGPGGPGSFYGIHDFGARKRQGKTGPSVWDVPGLDRYHGRDVHLTEVLAEEAVAEIRRSEDDPRPFLIHFAPYAVHAPIMANHRHLHRYAELHPREAAYATMIETTDAALGRILDTLDDLGLEDDTIVVFTSDNGGLSAHARGGPAHRHNAPLRSGKGSAYEGGVRVPLVIAGPSRLRMIGEGRRVSIPVSVIDLFPTLLELAGIEMPIEHAPTVDGHALTKVLRTEGETDGLQDRGLAWHMPHQWGASGPGIEPFTSYRRGIWKILYFHDGPRVELYDLQTDLGEARDLAAERPEVTRRLLRELDGWIDRIGADLSIDIESERPIPRPAEFASDRVK